MIEEIWKPVINYEGLYEISNYGKVKSFKNNKGNYREKILKLGKDKYGYMQIRLCKNGKHRYFKVHRLVLEAFVGPCPPGMEGCHNDGSRDNNFVGNLRWDTRKNNERDKIKHGTYQRGSKAGNAKLNDLKVRIIRRLLEDGYFTQREIAKIFNVSQVEIHYFARNKTWKNFYE